MARVASFALVLAISISAGAVGATTPPASSVPETPAPQKPDIERIGKGLFRIGNILLNKTSQTVRVPAEVNMHKGMIELVACSSGGKLHESLFLAHVEPYHFQIALLLLGLKPKGGIRFQGDPRTPRGDQVVIYVEKDGKMRRVEDYIWDIPRKAPMERTGWVFTGSRFVDGQFAAQMTRTLITTYHDPYTILDNPLPTGADDTVYEVNSRVTPPVGTTVTLVIVPAKSIKKPSAEKEGKK